MSLRGRVENGVVVFQNSAGAAPLPDGTVVDITPVRAEAGSPQVMSTAPREWKHLERRVGSSYQQLYVKGKEIWAWTIYCEFMHEQEPRTPEQLAEDWDIPLEAVHEAIAYGQSDPPEVREDHRKDALLSEAIGMNDPEIRRTGKVRPLSAEDRARLGL